MPEDRMLSVEEAFARIVSQFAVLETETVSLLDALGRVLAEDVVSAEDVPAFDNSAMDGYAVRFADTQAASEAQPVHLRVVGDLAAGAVPTAPLGPEEAVRIMTGAPVPPGSDAVVPFEDTDRTDWAKFGTRPGTSGDPATVGILLPPEFQDNVRFRAEDIKVGEQVLARGKRIRPAEIGVLASMGRVQVAVYRRPVVAIIPTGDEVIEIDRPLATGPSAQQRGACPGSAGDHLWRRPAPPARGRRHNRRNSRGTALLPGLRPNRNDWRGLDGRLRSRAQRARRGRRNRLLAHPHASRQTAGIRTYSDRRATALRPTRGQTEKRTDPSFRRKPESSLHTPHQGTQSRPSSPPMQMRDPQVRPPLQARPVPPAQSWFSRHTRLSWASRFTSHSRPSRDSSLSLGRGPG